MNDSTTASGAGTAEADQMTSALFAQLVMQQSNMAMMLLGKTAHSQTGETMQDLEAAKMFIDLLEMIEAKTRGNLSKDEASLLKSALLATRMAYVESSNAPAAAKPSAPEVKPPLEPAIGEPAAADATAEAENKKKFTKKY